MKYVRISNRRIGSKGKEIITDPHTYTGSPLKGYKRKGDPDLYRKLVHITWEQIQDMMKMQQYHVEIMSTEDYFLEEI